jgi:hypothetical protein
LLPPVDPRLLEAHHILAQLAGGSDGLSTCEALLLIPVKAITDSDLIPITCSDAMPIRVGAKRRWRSYGA